MRTEWIWPVKFLLVCWLICEQTVSILDHDIRKMGKSLNFLGDYIPLIVSVLIICHYYAELVFSAAVFWDVTLRSPKEYCVTSQRRQGKYFAFEFRNRFWICSVRLSISELAQAKKRNSSVPFQMKIRKTSYRCSRSP